MKKRVDALAKASAEDQPVGRHSSQVADIRTPKSAKGLNDSFTSNRSQKAHFSIRDEFSKDPKRKQHLVKAYWLDEHHAVVPPDEKHIKEFWDSGQYDVVKNGEYWLNNGKYIPEDIGDKVKEIINREVKYMKSKMQINEVKSREFINNIKVRQQR